MSKRFYFFVDSVDAAKTLMPEFKDLGLEDRNIHVIADEDTSLEAVPEPDPTATSDLFGAAKRGAITGSTMGLLGGVAAMSFPAAGLTLGGGALLFTTVLGGALGTWFSTLIGVSVPDEDIQKFQERIDGGEVMIVIETDEETAQKVVSVVNKRHPDTVIEHGAVSEASS